MTTILDTIVGSIRDKRRWRQYKARVRALPPDGRGSVEALERYLLHFGALTTGDVPTDVVIPMFDDLVARFEQAAADGTPVRAVVGDDAVEFAEMFFGRYSAGRWVSRTDDRSLSAIEREFHQQIDRGITQERRRMVDAIERATTKGARS